MFIGVRQHLIYLQQLSDFGQSQTADFMLNNQLSVTTICLLGHNSYQRIRITIIIQIIKLAS